MERIKSALRLAFAAAEARLGRLFPPAWNPLLNLGALGFFFYWIVTVSGIYIYVFFDTGVSQAYSSVEYMTRDQWFAAGVMRSLHRYASDALVSVMALHLLREFALDRYRGARWFSWVSGVPVVVLVYVAGITGYWLVWDRLAQYVATVSAEWLDAAGLFGEPIARNFLSPQHLSDRFFSLLVFLHIAVPLVALLLLWVHLQRIARPRINPPRGLAAGVLAAFLALALVYPAKSQGPADLLSVPTEIGLDWFYLPLFPVLERLPGPLTWSAALAVFAMFVAIPWLPPMRRPKPAAVDLANCNGCGRCFADCPYNAITMVARSDGRPFSSEARVDPALCVSCGICAGACPTATPFRRRAGLHPGIDLPERSLAALREAVHAAAARLTARPRILVFGCDFGPPLGGLESPQVGVVPLVCSGQLPPSFVDYVLSRDLAEGVVLTGCAEYACHNRFGNEWAKARMARARDPHLRERVPRHRLRILWAGPLGYGRLRETLDSFARELALTADPQPGKRNPSVLETGHA
ncbi:Cytochrome b6 [bacterium HR40]|nr:Cytochrome b6 [bacterium HR40]